MAAATCRGRLLGLLLVLAVGCQLSRGIQEDEAQTLSLLDATDSGSDTALLEEDENLNLGAEVVALLSQPRIRRARPRKMHRWPR